MQGTLSSIVTSHLINAISIFWNYFNISIFWNSNAIWNIFSIFHNEGWVCLKVSTATFREGCSVCLNIMKQINTLERSKGKRLVLPPMP